ncbi:MAG: hypothetical protein U0Q16_28390 [Bryobacteraceae bacterium]
MKALAIAVLALAAAPVHAQSEEALKRYFEGKQVRLKIDMPGTHHGADVYFRRDPPFDFKTYSQRMKNFGRALADGDVTRVTGVRVKSKNIEFQLGGGGYGTFGDDSGSVSLPVISKSDREKQLEKDVSRETDSRRKSDMQRELGNLQTMRRRDEERRRVRQAELETIKKAEIAQKRREGGSRFNIWFPDRYLAETVPAPEQVMDLLSEWVDFNDRPVSRVAPPSAAPALRPDAAMQLKRGLTRDQVDGMLGKPTRYQKHNEGALDVETVVWERAGELTEVDFVNGVVVKYRVSSR